MDLFDRAAPAPLQAARIRELYARNPTSEAPALWPGRYGACSKSSWPWRRVCETPANCVTARTSSTAWPRSLVPGAADRSKKRPKKALHKLGWMDAVAAYSSLSPGMV